MYFNKNQFYFWINTFMIFKFSLLLFLYLTSSSLFAELTLDHETEYELELSPDERLHTNESKKDYSIVPFSEYKQLNITPLYKDSIIKIYSDGTIFEEKSFSNDIYMNHIIGSNYIFFVDLKSYDPTEIKWSILCSVDKITDAKECSLSNPDIFYMKKSDKPSFLMIGGERSDLLRPTYLRVDKNKPFKVNYLGFKRPVLDNILKEMSLGNIIYLRYHKKYKEYPVDDEYSLKGFSIAYSTLNIIYSRLE